MNLRKVKLTDVDQLVIIHKEAFPDFFLTSLGEKFLKNYYYYSLKTKGSIAVCVENDHREIQGFAVGCLESAGFHKRVFLKSPIIFILSIMTAFIKSPKVLLRLLKNFEKKASDNDDKNYSELLSIAVKPEYKGRGLGKVLLNEFEKKILGFNGKKIALTTDVSNNQGVIAFYESNGYTKAFEFMTYPERRMFKMIKNLKE